jgi:hypothetical protein
VTGISDVAIISYRRTIAAAALRDYRWALQMMRKFHGAKTFDYLFYVDYADRSLKQYLKWKRRI